MLYIGLGHYGLQLPACAALVQLPVLAEVFGIGLLGGEIAAFGQHSPIDTVQAIEAGILQLTHEMAVTLQVLADFGHGEDGLSLNVPVAAIVHGVNE